MTERPSQPRLALAIVGSHTTAIAAEIAVETLGYGKPMAIIRRGSITTLPVAMDGEAWAKRLKKLPWIGARKEIQAFLDHIESMVGGEPYDCFIHHSTDPFSQLLAGHRLCRRYFYLEEGFTALLGGKFGRPKKRPFRKLGWKLRSRLFYGGKVDRYRDFFEVDSPKYGGACALSKNAFVGFPGRIQLPADHVEAASPPPAKTILFLDSQYFLGNCSTADYIAALTGCLAAVLKAPSSAAIKFHPGERDEARKRQIIAAVQAVGQIRDLTELPASFVGERMAFDPQVNIIVGTSAIGFYLGGRGFRTFTFAPRLIPASPRFARVMAGIPAGFLEVCQSA